MQGPAGRKGARNVPTLDHLCAGLAVWGVLVPLVVVGAHELADTQTLDKTEFPRFVEGIDADQGLHSHAALAI